MVAFEPESFDIVFTSYGVLSWLPDLVQWASAVATLLKPSGVFYLVEFHPFLLRLVDSTAESTDPRTALSGNEFRQRLPRPALSGHKPLRLRARQSYRRSATGSM